MSINLKRYLEYSYSEPNNTGSEIRLLKTLSSCSLLDTKLLSTEEIVKSGLFICLVTEEWCEKLSIFGFGISCLFFFYGAALAPKKRVSVTPPRLKRCSMDKHKPKWEFQSLSGETNTKNCFLSPYLHKISVYQMLWYVSMLEHLVPEK